MRVLLFSIAFILFIPSCDKKASYKVMLTNNNRKFWDISTNPGYCYEFEKSGICHYYYYNQSENGKRNLYFWDDIQVTNKWELINDSIIDIDGFKSLYKFINEDSLELTSLIDKKTKTIYFTSNNQLK